MTNDETCFLYILATLDAETSIHTTRMVRHVKSGEKYKTLKDFLIKTYSLSLWPKVWERAEHILLTTDLGDRKPSALVNHLMTLSGYKAEILLQQGFLHSLPH